MRKSVVIKDFYMPAAVAAAVVVIDQITKVVVNSRLYMGESVEVISGFFNIVNVRNTGAAFGIMSGGGAGAKIFLVVVAFVALVCVGFLIKQLGGRTTDFALSLIAGGAVGNLIDRVMYGSVIDFLDFYAGGFHWPAFNAADTCITTGALLAIIVYYFGGMDRQKG